MLELVAMGAVPAAREVKQEDTAGMDKLAKRRAALKNAVRLQGWGAVNWPTRRRKPIVTSIDHRDAIVLPAISEPTGG